MKIMIFMKIAFVLTIVPFDLIKAKQFRGFKTIPNTRGTSMITDTFDVTAITECSLRCRIKPNCLGANWKDKVCELLDESTGMPLGLVDAIGWTYMYNDMCASNPCKHGGSCTPLIGAYSCTCTWSFSGPTCELQSCHLFMNGVCYVLSSGPESWTSAFAKCNQAGGTLAEICDGNTNANLRNVMTGNDISAISLGATDYNLDTVFEWVTGSCSFDDYSNWYPGRPNNGDGDEYCMMMREDGKWNDVPCHEARHYFCQF